MRVALVYDRLNKVGGAEVVLSAFHSLYPEADWYTSVYNPKRTPFTKGWRIHSSLLSYLPLIRNHHELYPFLMPFIFESFDLTGYDLVISIGSEASKGVITRPETTHLHYCLTPTRYLWSHTSEYLSRPQFGLLQRVFTPVIKLIFHYLRAWDQVAATRPDHLISISERVKKRVKKYYNRDSQVIHPAIKVEKFAKSYHLPKTAPVKTTQYYLSVARLVPYKKLDLLVRAFRDQGRQLVIIGTGSELSNLRRLATPNVHLLGYQDEKALLAYYQHCKAFIQVNEEDFGLSMLEAQAAGKPVIAYSQGGAGEIVKPETGLLFDNQTLKGIRQALDQFETMQLNADKCYSNAANFDQKLWQARIKKYIKAQKA